jgi:hypothetical protein
MNSEPQPCATPPPVPVKLQRYEEPPCAIPPAAPRKKFWLHPASGLLILGMDWLLFAPEAATGLGVLVTVPLAFVTVTAGVFLIQRKRNHDSFGGAVLKALLGGVVAAIPTSIGGTILGTLILVLSGLSSWNQRRG